MSIFESLKKLLSRNSCNLESIEEFLLSNNFGVQFTERFLHDIKEKKINEKNAKEAFVQRVRDTFSEVNTKINMSDNPPTVMLFIGSNGSGKTTTIAKIANLFKKKGKDVLLIAGDTFRSAATEQLSDWALRIGVPIVKQEEGSDAASIVFDGLTSALSKGINVALVDTAGRVETKKNLINEIVKIERVIEKKIGRKPDETLLVIDAFTGQNSFALIETFKNAIQITGIALSKFDGSSAPGIIVPLIEKYHIPVKFIGTGEGINDIEYFEVDKYINKIL